MLIINRLNTGPTGPGVYILNRLAKEPQSKRPDPFAEIEPFKPNERVPYQSSTLIKVIT